MSEQNIVLELNWTVEEPGNTISPHNDDESGPGCTFWAPPPTCCLEPGMWPT